MSYELHLKNIKQRLDRISSTYCTAKWKQVTMHLQNGMTHSCHHPSPKVIPIAELRENHTALHNTVYKKEQRKLMLEGRRPSECDYCWRVEDSGDQHYSDRIHKSASDWAHSHLEEIAQLPWDHNVDPSYVEVNFSSACNFKCSYCAPHISSSWMEEIERWGPYPTSTKYNNLEYLKNAGMMPIPNRESNPYIDAFWKWWPDMYSKLDHFRVTGGEPLLNKDTFKILDYIIDHPNPQLTLSINTNLNPPPALFDNFIEKIKIISDNKFVKNFKLFTSAEAHGAQAEYIRYGMNYELWLDNINRIHREIPDISVTIMSTYNLLSVTTYAKFLKDVLDIKRQYGTLTKKFTMLLDIPYLRYPEHQSIFIMKPEMITMVKEQLDYMNSNTTTDTQLGFNSVEIDKLARILTILEQNRITVRTIENRKNFVKFVDEHDRRRGTDFKKTFPELTQFYEFCKTS